MPGPQATVSAWCLVTSLESQNIHRKGLYSSLQIAPHLRVTTQVQRVIHAQRKRWNHTGFGLHSGPAPGNLLCVHAKGTTVCSHFLDTFYSRPSGDTQAISHRMDISRESTECVALCASLREQAPRTSTIRAGNVLRVATR